MGGYSALEAVSNAVYARLNVPAVEAAWPTGAGATGGVRTSPTPNSFPFLWFEVREDAASHRSLGPGPSALTVELRLHAFSTQPSMQEAQRIIAGATTVLMASRLTLNGFQHVGILDFDAVPLPFEELNGVAVRELVKDFTLWIDQA